MFTAFRRLLWLTFVLIHCSVHSQTLWPVQKGKLWGYVTSQGDVRIPVQFETALPFQDGVAKVTKEGKSYLISPTGEIMSPKGIEEFSLVGNRLVFYKDAKAGLSDLEGNVLIPARYTGISHLPKADLFLYRDSGLLGLMDRNGNILTPARFSDVSNLRGIYQLIHDDLKTLSFYIPETGSLIQGNYEEYDYICGLHFFRKGKTWDVFNPDSMKMQEKKWSSVQKISDSYFLGIEKKDTSIYYKGSVNPVLNKYDQIIQTWDDRLVVKLPEGKLIVDRGLIAPDTFDVVNLLPNREYYVKNNQTCNILDSTFTPLLPWKYLSATRVTPNSVLVLGDQGWGAFSTLSGSELVSCRFAQVMIYDDLVKSYSWENALWMFNVENGVAIDSMEFINHKKVYANNMKVPIDKKDAENQPLQRTFRPAGAWYLEDGKWGYRSPNKILIKPQFGSYTQIGNSPYTIVKKHLYSPKTGRIAFTFIGLVDESRGKITMKPSYTFIDQAAAANPNLSVIRGRLSNGRFDLVEKATGKKLPYNAAFIGDFVNGRARIYLNGQLIYVGPPDRANLGPALPFFRKYNYSIGKAYDRLVSINKRRYQTPEVNVYPVGGYWDYIDENGDLLMHMKSIENAEAFDPNNAVITIRDSCALINREGTFITPLEYGHIKKTGVDSTPIYLVDKPSQNLSYFTPKGVCLGGAFEGGTDLNEGAAWVKQGPEYFILRSDGTVTGAVPATPVGQSFYAGYSVARNSEGWLLVDTAGQIAVTPGRSRIAWTSEGYYAQRVQIPHGKKVHRGYQFFDIDGNRISEAIFQRTYPFNNGYAPVRFKNGKMGFVSTSGALVKGRYSRIYTFEKNGVCEVLKGRRGVINTKGEWVAKARYQKITIADSTILAFRGKTLDVFDLYGNRLNRIRSVWSFGDFHENRARISLRKKSGYIGPDGQWVVKPQYRWCSDYGDHAAIVMDDTKKVLVLNLDGDVMATPNLYARPRYSEGIILGRTALGMVFYNKTGQRINQDIYDYARPFKNGVAYVRKDGKWGLIDREGQYIIPMEFSSVSISGSGEITARTGASFGLLDINGKAIVPCAYDQINYDKKEKVFRLLQGSFPTYLNAEGKWLWNEKPITGI